MKALVLSLAGLVLLLVAFGAGLFLYSPALLVDMVDRVASRADVVKTQDGISFGPNAANKLDIWSTSTQGKALKPVLVFSMAAVGPTENAVNMAMPHDLLSKMDMWSWYRITAMFQRFVFLAFSKIQPQP